MRKKFFPIPEFEATSNQVCGLWPFAGGGSLPTVGVPLGTHEHIGKPVCLDPINWFLHSEIRTPTCFVLGLPGLGKSSLLRHMILLLRAQGVVPMVLSDIRPDYVALGQLIGCATPKIGPSHHSVNPLDPGPIKELLPRLTHDHRTDVIAQFAARRLSTLTGLMELNRGRPLKEFEHLVLQHSLEALDPDLTHEVTIPELSEFIASRPDFLKNVLRVSNTQEFDDRVTSTLDSLQMLCAGGPFGAVFSRRTSVRVDPSQGVVFDLSEVIDSSDKMQAALQLVTWSLGTSIVAASKIEAKHIGGHDRTFIVVADEMWKMLKASPQMAHRIDTTLRLVRTMKLPLLMCTHSITDLQLSDPEASAVAQGLIEKCDLKISGGITAVEVELLHRICQFSDKEKQMLVSWSSESKAVDAAGRSIAPGRGRFLAKGGGHSIPFRVRLPESTIHVHDTNVAWSQDRAKAGAL